MIDGGTVTGEVAWVPDAPGAEVLVVVGSGGEIVAVDAADAEIEPVAGYDATRSLGHVRLDGAACTPRRGATPRPRGTSPSALLAAEAVGAIELALEISVAYAKERFTFGRAIGSYQAIKHELVEILRRLENARSLMFYAGWAAADRPEELARRGVGVPARGLRGLRPRLARADLRARRDRRDLGARRAALLPPGAARQAAAGRGGRRRRPRRRRAVRPGARRRVIVWTHHRWRFPLPAGHKFPIDKYALLRDRVIADGTAGPGEVHEAEPVPWEWLEAVHDGGLLERIRTGALSVREERGLGLPWSEALVERGRRSTHGTVLAARHAAAHGLGMNLGGGTHHAGRDFARGYCLFNDVGVALRRLREEGLAERALVLDCDVHQGDGTAQMLGPDPGAFTVSLHGARNYPFQRIPSDLDVDLATGTGDERYLRALGEALDFALPRAGPTSPSTSRAPTRGRATGSAGCRSARPACAPATSWRWTGCSARACACASCWRAATRTTCADTVDINAATAAVVAERLATTLRSPGA